MSGSTLIPTLRYRNARAAIDWLCDTLGFYRQAVYSGPENTVAHAQLTLGHGMIMLGSASNANPYSDHLAHPDEIGGRLVSPVYVVVPDCNPVYARVQASGGKILRALETMDYGGLAFTVADPEGYLWSVGEYDPWATPDAATSPSQPEENA